MKISKTFEVAQPRQRVWDLFQDVPRVAMCIPGTRLTDDSEDGKFKGRVDVKLGPIAAAFEGEATHEPDVDHWSGKIAGTGQDRSAGSRARFSTHYVLTSIDGGTRVSVESDISLAGAVAQFGRTGLVEQVTTHILHQFATNLEAELSQDPGAQAPAPDRELNMGAILWSGLWARLRALCSRLLGRRSGEDR